MRPFVNDVTIFGLGQGFCDNQAIVVKEVCQKLLEVIYGGPPLCCIGCTFFDLYIGQKSMNFHMNSL